MISVIVPTLNAEAHLARTLAPLVAGVVRGLVREVIIVDGGSTDATAEIADASGAHFIEGERGRGAQLALGARHARASWLLFLHADTILEPGWVEDASAFMESVEEGKRPLSAAAFRFALNDFGLRPRMLERLVALRCFAFGLPYGDQGLLIPASLYAEVGGYRALPLMEDVDLARRVGRRRLAMLPSRAITSAARFKKTGYAKRVARNLSCLALYYLHVPPRYLVRLYE